MSYLLDTVICIALLKGKDEELIAKIRSREPSDFRLSSVVRGELLFGARNSQHVDRNLSLLNRFFSQFDSLAFDDRAADFYGLIRASLESAGTPIGANDLLLASIAEARDLTLITRNRSEFARVPGLRWESW